MPKFNMYQALHTTVIGPEGRPLEIQIRTQEMHDTAEYGIAAHWIYKDGRRQAGRATASSGSSTCWTGRRRCQDPQEFAETLKADLFEDEVFVFTPQGRGQVARRPAPRRSTSPTRSTPTWATAAWAPRSTARSCRCTTSSQSGDICEVLTSKKERGPSRDWLALAKTTRAQSKIRAWFKRERREDSERTGREILHEALKRQGLPPQKIAGSPLLADVIREMGFRKARRLLHRARPGRRSRQGRDPEGDAPPARRASRPWSRRPRRPSCSSREARRPSRRGSSSSYGIKVEGVDDVMLRLAKCCRPGARRPDRGLHLARQGHHDPPRDLPQRQGADAQPRALHRRSPGTARALGTSFRVELEVDGWDRTRLLEDLSRTFAETGINILEARCTVVHPMVKNRFVVEVGDTAGAEDLHHAAAQHRVGVRRLSGHADDGGRRCRCRATRPCLSETASSAPGTARNSISANSPM